MSYTVVCSGCPRPQDLIVSFRQPDARLDEGMVKLAKEIHGDLVPESTYHGILKGADPPLHIYSMPYLRGSSCIEVLASQAEMDPDEEVKHEVFVKHLAQYISHQPRMFKSLLAHSYQVLCAMLVQFSVSASPTSGGPTRKNPRKAFSASTKANIIYPAGFAAIQSH